MSAPHTPPQTKKRYQDVFDRLDQFALSAGLKGPSDEFPYGRVVDAYLAQRIHWTPRTESSYKAALIHVLDVATAGNGKDTGFASYYAKRRLLGLLEPSTNPLGHFSCKEEQDAAVEHEKEFQRQRQIRLQQRAFDSPQAKASRQLLLLEALKCSGRTAAPDARRWYQAALLTGIAPTKWKDVTWVDCGRNRFALCISDGVKPERIAAFVALDRLTTDQLSSIRAHVETVDAKVRAGVFSAWYDACRAALRAEARSLWPGQQALPTLHPPRHLLAAAVYRGSTMEEANAGG